MLYPITSIPNLYLSPYFLDFVSPLHIPYFNVLIFEIPYLYPICRSCISKKHLLSLLLQHAFVPHLTFHISYLFPYISYPVYP